MTNIKKFSMSSKMILFFVFTLSLTSISCEDWCSLIKPNGTYKGLGMYRYFEVQDKGIGSFLMYNRAGAEWKFQINYTDDMLSLKMIENSTKESANEDVVHRIGFYIFHRSDPLKDKKQGSVFDCTIKTAVRLHFICFSINLLFE